MGKVAFRVDSAERERVISSFIQAALAGNSDTIACPRDLAHFAQSASGFEELKSKMNRAYRTYRTYGTDL